MDKDVLKGIHCAQGRYTLWTGGSERYKLWTRKVYIVDKKVLKRIHCRKEVLTIVERRF